MLELKQYQENTIEALEDFCRAISDEKGSVESCGRAWHEVGGLREYKPRFNKLYKNIPSVCLKIPTGGGKTLLGIKSISAINREYLHKDRGLIVWIVPTKAIYQQTLKNLKNYDHPYRRELDRIAPNRRAKIKEKKDKIHPAEIENDLVVLLLMLQSANREDQEPLKMYQADSKYIDFFPESDDILSSQEMLKEFSNLEAEKESEFKISIKSSLGNVLKICQPIVILDEAHKASAKSRIAPNTINEMNPSFLLELTATPVENDSNILVDISGLTLKKEHMIKLPIDLMSQTNAEWQDIVYKSANKLKELEKIARKNETETGDYIRPINIIRVERTGKDQIDKGYIHAKDVKKYLIEKMKYREEEVRIKATDNDELGNEDLLSPQCKVKIIITKEALREGWDCPFAYILTILDNAQSPTGLTQMLGRVLRQPYTRAFEDENLNTAYVICLNPDVRQMVRAIEKALQDEGLGDARHLINKPTESNPIMQREVERNKDFRGISYIIPKVLIKIGKERRLLEYEKDILSNVRWADIKAPVPSLPLEDKAEEISRKIDLDEEYKIRRKFIFAKGKIKAEEIAFHIDDIIPNTWQAMRIAREYIDQLASHTEEQQYNNKQHYISEIKTHVQSVVDRMAEKYFEEGVKKENIYLNFDAEHCKWEIPEKIARVILQNDLPLTNEDGNPVQSSLFEREIERHYNQYEGSVAAYLDRLGGKNTIQWWHRVAKGQEFGIQGWRKHLIYPDFIMLCSMGKYIYLETKGEQLRELQDTKMKKQLFKLLTGGKKSVGKSSIKCKDQIIEGLDLQIIYQNEWSRQLEGIFSEVA